MLFYAGLTVASVLAAAVLIWVIRSMSEAGKSAYRTLSPAARNRPRTRLAHLNSNLASTPSPWGWDNSNQSRPTTVSSKRVKNPTNLGSPRATERMQRTNLELMMDGVRDDQQMRSARNVLTGYDLSKPDPVTDTSSWPYRDSLEDTSESLVPKKRKGGQLKSRS